MRFIEQDVALENLLQHVRVSLLQDHARGRHEVLQDVGLLLKMQIDYDPARSGSLPRPGPSSRRLKFIHATTSSKYF